MTFYFNEYGLADSTWNTSSGSIAYGYNAFGELISQTDANGNTYNLQFDKLGRIISKQGPEGTSTYNYVSSGNRLGQLQSVTGPDGISKSFAYDTLSQVIQLKDSIPDEQEFITGFTYDSWGNNTSITYPSGVVINNYYSNGYLSEIKKSGDISIWELDDVNGSGNPLQFTLGSANLRTNFTYDTYGNIRYKQTGNMEQEFWYEPEDLGRLTSRGYKEYGSPSGLAESFGYDDLDRLNFIGTYGRPYDTIRYDNAGNISFKSGIGDYSYKANSNSLETITNIVDTTFISNQSLTYTESNMTASISQEPYELQLVYGPGNQRIKSILKENNDTVKTKYFSSNYEKIISDSTTKEIYYIYCPYGLIAVIVKNGETENLYYTETDNLGSIIGLINPDGTYAEHYSYDAWGRRRNSQD